MTAHTPMTSSGSVVWLAGGAAGFSVAGCPDSTGLAALIAKACTTHQQLVDALQGVVRVADRATVEFDAARAILGAASIMGHADARAAAGLPALPAPTQAAPGEWVRVADRLPEAGEMVLVYSPPQPHDWPGTINISFDAIDPECDDHTTWLIHGEYYEHYCAVACEDMTGPSEKAPYTHWCRLPAAPQVTV